MWIDFDPVKGHEQGGRRPAIIISPDKYNLVSNRALICPITSKVKGHVFEVAFAGTYIKGSILADQVRTMDFDKRNVVFVEKAKITVTDEVEAKLLTLIQS